jgi:hypothetical protein
MDVSDRPVPFYVSFVLIAAFLALNILIGVVINTIDDRRVALLGHLHELRQSVEALEHELIAAEREFASDRRGS